MATCRECARSRSLGADGPAAAGGGRGAPDRSRQPHPRVHSAGPTPDVADRGRRRGDRRARPQAAGSLDRDVSAATAQGARPSPVGHGRRSRMHLSGLRLLDVRHGRARGWRYRGIRPARVGFRVGHGTGIRGLGTAHGLEQFAIACRPNDRHRRHDSADRARIVGDPRRTAAVALRDPSPAGGRHARHADFRGDRRTGRFAVLVRVHARDGGAACHLPTLGATPAAGHSAVHAGWLHLGRRRRQPALGARLFELARVAARWLGGHHGRGIRLLYIVYGRLRRHDPLARRADPPRAGQVALFAGLLPGPDDGLGIHRTALPAQSGGDPVRRLLAHAAQRTLSGRAASRLPAGSAGGPVGRAPRARRRARPAQVRPSRGARLDEGGQVGAAPAAGRDRRHLQRHCDAGRSRGSDRAVRLRGRVSCASRPFPANRAAEAVGGVLHVGRGGAADPGRRSGLHKLPDRRASARSRPRVGPVAH